MLRSLRAGATLSFFAAFPQRVGGQCRSHVGDTEFASFALCCQAQQPASAAKADLCGGSWDCDGLLQCQMEELASAPSLLQDRTPGVAEMRMYFEHLMGIYLTGEIPDPVFLDIEHVIPSIFLALAAAMPPGSPDVQVLDVGAYAGSVSCACIAFWDAVVGTASAWPGGPGTPPSTNIRVLALEPSPQRCRLLNSGGREQAPPDLDLCKHEPRSAGRIRAACVAASSSNGEATLQCPQQMSFLAEKAPKEGWYFDNCGESATVRTVRLDNLLVEEGIAKVDLLKIDAEGHDFDVLRGASESLKAGKIRFVIFEVIVHPDSLRSHAAAMVQLMESAAYECFILAPEMLVPLKGPWLTNLYVATSHAWNTLCAREGDPLMREIIMLYSRVPRATQFSLAAIGVDAGRQEHHSDAALRRRAVAAERYFQAMYEKTLQDGWSDLPHVQYMRARLMQAAGKVELAMPIYKDLQREPCCREPSTFQAQREYHRLSDDLPRKYMKEVGYILDKRNRTTGVAVNEMQGGMLHELVWYHRRPGSGAAFDQEHACQAQSWLRPLALLGEPLAALELGLIAEFGLCQGTMSRQGLAEATSWYRIAREKDRVGMAMGRWGLEAHNFLEIATRVLREEQRAG
ncbi:unnamed protein product [Symbiodinium sp. CCMP2592]|nr:unnamed protein product [Symbiodinium sp. CCMP2592]